MPATIGSNLPADLYPKAASVARLKTVKYAIAPIKAKGTPRTEA